MKIAYFECFAGASGDMILGALLDSGLELEKLKTELAKLSLPSWDIQAKQVIKRGIGGTRALVITPSSSAHDTGSLHVGYHHENHHEHPHHQGHVHRNLHDIRHIIENSRLTHSVMEKSLKIFYRLAEAEAKVHRKPIDKIHFHEVGAMDAIIDVVGAVAGLELLGIETVYCSPLHTGTGTVTCAHGILPVPAPATLELVCGKPVYSMGVQGELLTPTGAAILTTLAENFGPMPEMTVEQIGYGAGENDPEIPNLLRITIGKKDFRIKEYQADCVGVLETAIDDMNPQIYDYLMEKLYGMGILDIFLIPVQMKKNRPATMVKVLCPEKMIGQIADFLLRETTSIGLRWHIEQRIKTYRKIREIETAYGPVRFKEAFFENGDIINLFPEYDDCKRVATEKGVPLKKVMEQAMVAALQYHIRFL